MNFKAHGKWSRFIKENRGTVARPKRLELLTVGLENRCSIQLSYGRTSVQYPIATALASGIACMGDSAHSFL